MDHGATDVVVDVQGWFEAATRTWTYSYDGDGLRASKTAPDGTVTQFTWDRSAGVPLLLSEATGGVRTFVIYGPGGRPYAEVTGTAVHYHHRDRLGSTATLTDAAGSVVHAASYTVNGEIATSTGAVAPLLGWAGEQRDPETGLVYLRARFYDPTTSQFLTRDPAVELTGEPYAYASNNPVTYIDPLGLFSLRDAWNATGGKVVSGAANFVEDPGGFIVRNRETIANVGAVVACVGTVGSGCVAATAIAVGVRAQKRIDDHGVNPQTIGTTVADGVVSFATLGLVKVPVQIATGRIALPLGSAAAPVVVGRTQRFALEGASAGLVAGAGFLGRRALDRRLDYAGC